MLKMDIPQLVTSQLLSLGSRISNKNLLRLVELLERYSAISWHERGFTSIKQLIQEDHPGIQAARRAIRQSNAKVRTKLVNNFILGGLLQGYRKRLEFYNEHGVAPPGTLMISPSMRCNLSCYGCCTGTHERDAGLSREETEDLIRQAGQAGTNVVCFLGGEPLMVPWLLDVIEAFPDTAFQIYTNGLLLNQTTIERLARSGNTIVTINVDGSEEENDRRKGKGTFKRALQAMRSLADAGVITGFSSMLSRYNFDSVYSDEFIDTMIEHGAAYGWISIAIPQGKACTQPDIVPTPEQKAQIAERVARVRRQKDILLIDFHNDAYITEGCGAGRIVIHVNANGDVEPCILFPFALDNIRDKPLAEIMKSSFLSGIRGISKSHPANEQTCMLVNHPAEVLQVIESTGARTTSPGTMEMLQEQAGTPETDG